MGEHAGGVRPGWHAVPGVGDPAVHGHHGPALPRHQPVCHHVPLVDQQPGDMPQHWFHVLHLAMHRKLCTPVISPLLCILWRPNTTAVLIQPVQEIL